MMLKNTKDKEKTVKQPEKIEIIYNGTIIKLSAASISNNRN